jgi:hypothetical protein
MVVDAGIAGGRGWHEERPRGELTVSHESAAAC